jgi:hypothetical protein
VTPPTVENNCAPLMIIRGSLKLKNYGEEVLIRLTIGAIVIFCQNNQLTFKQQNWAKTATEDPQEIGGQVFNQQNFFRHKTLLAAGTKFS